MIAALTELHETLLRHEAEITSCLEAKASSERRMLALEAEVSRLRRLFESEQLYRQGQELITGDDMIRSLTLGLSLLKESAGLGHGDAAFACGRHFQRGVICEQNNAESERYFTLSSSLGTRLGLDLSHLFSHPNPNPEEGLRALKASVDRGSAVAQIGYAQMLREGRDIAKDEAEALRYLKLAADQGNPAAQMTYMAALLDGPARNPAAVVEYARALAAKGSATGQAMYGSALLDGEGVEKNEVDAAKYLKLAAYQHNPVGMLTYGQCLKEGRGIPQDVILGEGFQVMGHALSSFAIPE
jgi:TPR repeat protein